MGNPSGADEIRLIQRQLTQLLKGLESIMQPEGGTDHPGGICVDTYLTEQEVIFIIDLPGVAQDTLKVTISRDSLYLEGARPRPKTEPEQKFVMAERPFGPFKRELDLPATVDTSKVKARLQDGLLIIRMPRMAERRGRAREVTVEYANEE